MNYSPLEILLDTTYLLPILGVDIPGIGEVLEAVEKLYEQDKAILFYSPVLRPGDVLIAVGYAERKTWPSS